MHSLVGCMCPDQGLNLQPWNFWVTFKPTELPGQGSSELLLEPSIWSPCCLTFSPLFNINLMFLLFYFKTFVIFHSPLLVVGPWAYSKNSQPQSRYLWHGGNNCTCLTRLMWRLRINAKHIAQRITRAIRMLAVTIKVSICFILISFFF